MRRPLFRLAPLPLVGQRRACSVCAVVPFCSCDIDNAVLKSVGQVFAQMLPVGLSAGSSQTIEKPVTAGQAVLQTLEMSGQGGVTLV